MSSSASALPEIEEPILDEGGGGGGLNNPYHVILLNDDDHTYEYVVEMLMDLFAMSESQAAEHTTEVDTKGHTRLATLPFKEAEKKRDKIHAYGPDPRLERCPGAMAALIEPAA